MRFTKGHSQEWLRYQNRSHRRTTPHELRLFGCWAAEALLEGGVETVADVLGQGERFGVAEDFDGFPRGIDQQAAIVAATQMIFDLLDGAFIELAVEKIAEFCENRFTVRFLAAHF
jgi:hypothetical protein